MFKISIRCVQIRPNKLSQVRFNVMKKSTKKLQAEVKIAKTVLPLPVSLNKTGQIRITVLAKPGAKTSSITGIEEEGICVQIGARPVDGEANTELVRFIAEVLLLKKSEVSLDKGCKSRQKVVVLSAPALTVDTVMAKLKLEVERK